jgi:hypothetical protein
MDDLVERMVEAGARALFKAAHGRDGYHDAVPATQRNLQLKARACLTAALAAAEADGAVLTRVPGEMPARAMEPSFGAGHNACRAAIRAGKVTP